VLLRILGVGSKQYGITVTAQRYVEADLRNLEVVQEVLGDLFGLLIPEFPQF
jgi:hypothetical protein